MEELEFFSRKADDRPWPSESIIKASKKIHQTVGWYHDHYLWLPASELRTRGERLPCNTVQN